MVVEQVYVRLLFVVTAIAVLALVREPYRRPDRPGSRGFLVVIVGASLWLASGGLTYFAPGREATLALYNVLLFAILVTVLGVSLLAYEYSTQRIASRRLLLALAAVSVGYGLLLWTNAVWLHELVYTADSSVDDAVLVPARGPAFWALSLSSHALVVLSIGLFAREFVGASGPRRRQSALLALALVPAAAANGYWLYADHDLGWDPTPVGVVLGVTILGVALYRTSLLDLVPVARRTVVEEMPDAVVTLGADGRVLDWNAAAIELFGVEEPSAGMAMDAFFERLDEADRDALRSDDPTDIAITVERADRPRHCAAQVSPIDLDGAGGAGRVVTVRDVTPAVQRERQLVDANDSLEAFAEIVSHDVQGPLMELRGSADVAIATGDVDQVEHVHNGIDRMDALVDDMLDLARSGQRIDETSVVSLAEATRAAWRSVWATDADLVVATDGRVRADPDRLQQLLENCFRNAVEHAGPAVTVTVGELDDSDGFYVEDDGPGIPAADRDRVFERGVSGSEDGTGLGLGIVREIVDAHGWSVRVVAAADGGARLEFADVELAP